MRRWMLVTVATAGPVFGQGADPLGGPRVEVDAVPGQEATLTGEPERGVRAVPFRVFMRSLGVLEGTPTALSSDQRGQIETIRAEFFAA